MAVKKGPPKSGGARPKVGKFVDPKGKWGGPDPEEVALKKALTDYKKASKDDPKTRHRAASVAFDKFDEMTRKPNSVMREIAKLQHLLASPHLDAKTKANLQNLMAEGNKALKKATEESVKQAKKSGANILAQQEVLSRLAFVKSLLTSGKEIDKKDRKRLERMQLLLEGTNNQLMTKDLDPKAMAKLAKRAGDIDDTLKGLDKETRLAWAETQKALDRSIQAQLDANELLTENAEQWKTFRKNVEDKFLDVTKKIGIGFVNVANVYKVGKAAYKTGKFLTNKDYRKEAISNSFIGKAQRFVNRRKDVAQAKETVRGGDFQAGAGFQGGAKPQATARALPAPAAMQGDFLAAGEGPEEQPQKVLLRLENKIDKAIEEDKKQGTSLVTRQEGWVKEQTRDAKKFHRGALSALGKAAAADAGGGGASAIVGALSSMSAAILPFLAVAGSFIGAWMVGKALYEKNATAIQDGLDKLTGGSQAAAGKEATREVTPEEIAAARAKRLGTGAAATPFAGGGGTSGGGGASGSVPAPETPTATPVAPPTPSASSEPSSGAKPVAVAANIPTAAADAGGGSGAKLEDVISKNGKVDTDGLNPGIKSNLVGMAGEYKQATGKKLTVNSANRDMAEQEQLYKTKPKGMAAKPGSSLHNYGLAVDVSSQQAGQMDNMGLLKKWGFTRPISNEPWHMQPAGATLAAAKSGLFSADAPKDQGVTQVAGAGKSSPVADKFEVPDSKQEGNPASVAVSGGKGGAGATMSGSSKVGVNDVPTFDTSDGHLIALNLGVA